MERTDRTEGNDPQKTKFVFLFLAAVVAVILIWSFVAANKARSERNAAVQELETTKSDNMKLEQMVKDLNQENESLKKKVQELESKAKAKAKVKAKPAPKKKTAKTRKTSKKKSH